MSQNETDALKKVLYQSLDHQFSELKKINESIKELKESIENDGTEKAIDVNIQDSGKLKIK